MFRLTLKLRNLIKFQIFFILLIEGAISLLHIPSYFKYVVDLNFIIMLIWTVLSRQIIDNVKCFPKGCKKIFIYIIILMVGCVVIALFKMVPLGQILWGIRNTFFTLIFFIICALNLKSEDVERIFDGLLKLQLINLLCGVYEYYVLDVHNDYLGGMFGTEQGCNGALNMYLIIICVYTLTKYLNKRINTFILSWIFMSSVVMATMAELKVFYIEVILIVILCVLINRKSFKSFMTLAICVVLLFFGVTLLSNINSNSARVIKSIEAIIEYNSTTDYDGDIVISRLTSFSQINDYFFDDNASMKLLGFGLGGCEDSKTFAWFNSGFAERYRNMRYRDLTISMSYLETGYMGVVAFLIIFIVIFGTAYGCRKITSIYDYANIVQVLCILFIFTCWYDSSIRSFSGYVIYFTFASIFVVLRDNYKKQKMQESYN